MASTQATWRCPTCPAEHDTPFCPTCGEERPGRLTLKELGKEAVEAALSLDGKLMRSLHALIARPGKLTAAYVAGQRRAYVGPLTLFLAANALFFAVQSMSKTNIFATPLDGHLHHQDWSAVAGAMTARHLAAKATTLAAYAPLFDQAAVLNAKALIILMPLVFWPLPALLFAGRKQPLIVHGVFALHLYAFLLLLFCLALALSTASVLLGGPSLEATVMDVVLSVFNLVVCVGYLYLAIGTVYGARGWTRAVQAAALTAVVSVLVLGYRFAVFAITLGTT